MGIPEQDLIFKLKSIGIRVEGEDSQVDSEVLQALLQGKRMPHPKEVILRDQPGAPGGRRVPLPPRRPPNPLRPGRPRTMIHRVEPKIRTLPSSEPRATITAREKAAQEAAARQAEEAARKAAILEAQAEAAKAKAAAEAEAASAPKAKKGEAPEAPKKATGGEALTAKQEEDAREVASRLKTTRPKAPTEGERPTPTRPTRQVARQERKPRRVPRRAASGTAAPSLRSFRGRGGDTAIPAPTPEDLASASGRRKRRVERKTEERARGGTQVAFKEGKPEGPVMISEGMTVRDFAEKLGVKSKDLIKALFSKGIMANINHVLEPELAQEVAEDLGVESMVVSFEEEVQLTREIALAEDDEATAGGTRQSRAPVVTIMGHVDHGKTTLLDSIRSSKVTEGEFGGITQHIGAYEVDINNRKIVFLDTPGHEAFTTMRARGAKVTDIVVLVVAADDGVMPQTLEAINHARAADVPMIIAVNKVDKANANPDRVKKELADHNILVEEWGGDIVSVPISALKGQGIDELLEMILLQADILELKASPDVPAQGIVLEARKEVGRGIIATVLVQNGSLTVSDSFVSGKTWGRVRSMVNDLGERLEEVGPSTPVEVTGFNDVPEAGDPFQVLADEAKARSIADFRSQENRQRSLSPTQGRMSLDQLFSRIEAGEVKELPVILKADVQGSVEVIRDTLEKLSTEKVRVRVIASAVGGISTNDIILATASDAVVIGFNVRPERNASEMAEKEGIDLRLHTVIYELVDELKAAMAGLLEPTIQEVTRGRAEVRETFKIPKIGTIAGCHVLEGVVKRGAPARLLRDNVVVHDGKVGSLRRFKEDATEVRAGFDCGIGLERFQDLKPGDVIEVYEREEVAATL
jgi:translation initiation factor IF-2